MNATETIRFIIPVFCLATMFSMGLDLKLDDVLAPFRNWLALVIIVVTNNILVPLLGFLLVALPEILKGTPLAGLAEQLVPLTSGQQIGFLLLFLAAGSLLGPVLVQLSGVPIPFAKGIMVVLVGVSALLVPVELSLFTQASSILPGAKAIVPTGSVFLTLLIYQLAPLAVGILINSQYRVIAVRLRPLIVQLTSLTLLLALAALMTPGLGLISVPGSTPTVATTVATTTVSTTTVSLDETAIRSALKEKIDISKANLKQFTGESKWVSFDPATSYILTRGGNINAPTLSVSSATQENIPVSGKVADRITELNAGQLSTTLQAELKTHQIQPPSTPIVVVIQKNEVWLLVDSATTYIVVEDDSTPGTVSLSIFQEQPQPQPELLVTFLKSLAALPVIGPAIDFLTKLIVILVPYALFGAVAALLLVIGYYCGVAIRSIVGMKDAVIPRTLAISTGVRNVSMALIIATQHLFGRSSLLGTTELDLSSIVVILSFFLVNLIVAAIQATKWAGQPDTAPVLPPSQAPTVVIAPGREVTSTP